MALDSYSNLKTAIADWLDRSDLTDQIDDFIDLAEARMGRELRYREILVHDTAFAIADGDRYLALPADFQDIKLFRIIIPNAGTAGVRFYPDFDQVSMAEMTDRSTNDIRRPGVYAVHTQIELDAEADQAYTGELFYYKAVTALSDGNTSNEHLVKAPDCYLFGSLAASAPFLMNDERVNLWETLYAQARDTINEAFVRNNSAGPMVAKVQNIPRRAIS